MTQMGADISRDQNFMMRYITVAALVKTETVPQANLIEVFRHPASKELT
jgi:hypothetical protein